MPKAATLHLKVPTGTSSGWNPAEGLFARARTIIIGSSASPGVLCFERRGVLKDQAPVPKGPQP